MDYSTLYGDVLSPELLELLSKDFGGQKQRSMADALAARERIDQYSRPAVGGGLGAALQQAIGGYQRGTGRTQLGQAQAAAAEAAAGLGRQESTLTMAREAMAKKRADEAAQARLLDRNSRISREGADRLARMERDRLNRDATSEENKLDRAASLEEARIRARTAQTKADAAAQARADRDLRAQKERLAAKYVSSGLSGLDAALAQAEAAVEPFVTEDGKVVEGGIPGVGYAQNVPGVGGLINAASQLATGDRSGSHVRQTGQDFMNKVLKAEVGSQQTISEAQRQAIARGMAWNASDADYLAGLQTAREAVEYRRSAVFEGFDENVQDAYRDELYQQKMIRATPDKVDEDVIVLD